MTTNKQTIIEDLVQVETVEGWKALQRLRIDEGQKAVITIDGRFREVIESGARWLGNYPPFTQCKVYRVQCQDRQLSVVTEQELNILYKDAPFALDMAATVTYRVVTPQVVAIAIEKPLTMLFDFIVEAASAVIGESTVSALHDRSVLGRNIFQLITDRKLEDYLGIKVVNFHVSEIRYPSELKKLMDEETVGNDKWELERKRKIWDAELRARIAEMFPFTQAYIIQNHPDIYPQIFGDRALTDEKRIDILMELVKTGQLSLADLRDVWSTPDSPVPDPGPYLPLPFLPPGNLSARKQLSAECEGLQQSGLGIDLREDLEESNRFYVSIKGINAHNGLPVVAYFICDQAYPQQPPQLIMEVDGVQCDFSPQSLVSWSPDSGLRAVIDEIQGYYE